MNNEPLGMFGTLWWMWNNWDKLYEHWQLVLQAFIGLMGAITMLASIITPLTKTPKDDEALAWLKNWLHQFSVTNAKDVKGIGQQPAEPAPPVPPQNTELPSKGSNGHILRLFPLLFLLVGCTTPQTPAQTVYQLQADYAAALSLENSYGKLPECGSAGNPILCRDNDFYVTVRKVDDVAWEAIKAAQTAVRTPGFGQDHITTAVATATNAVAAFKGITQTLKVN